MTYGEKIREIRRNRGMNMREFGQLVGYDFTYIGLLERGISHAGSLKPLNPSIGVLKDICDRSGYDFRTFLEETGYLPSTPQNCSELAELQQLYSVLSATHKGIVLGMLREFAAADSEENETVSLAVELKQNRAKE